MVSLMGEWWLSSVATAGDLKVDKDPRLDMASNCGTRQSAETSGEG